MYLLVSDGVPPSVGFPMNRAFLTIYLRLEVRHIPTWFPGAEFKRSAEVGRKLTEDMINVPYEDVKRKRVRLFLCQ